MKESSNCYCYANLPRTGLGNMLFIWAHAQIFAGLNSLPLIVSDWDHIKLGPVLRGERIKRRYGGYFQEAHPLSWMQKQHILRTYARITEPPVAQLPDHEDKTHKVYVFENIPHWADYFGQLKPYRDSVLQALLGMLAPEHYQRLQTLAPPVIGVHIRMGDFRPLQPNENFAQVGNVRTPLGYFQDIINGIRQIHGSLLPVTIFSDGHDHELAPLLEMAEVQRAPQNIDILDILLLSRSQLVVTAACSTFSYWSAFLSNAPVIMHPDHIHQPLRSDVINQSLYEGSAVGPADQWPRLLQDNIKELAGHGNLL